MAADMAAGLAALGQMLRLLVAREPEVEGYKEVFPAVVSPWEEDVARIFSQDVSHQEVLI